MPDTQEKTLFYTKIIISVFILCWVGIVWQYTNDTNDNICFTQYELDGAEYNSELMLLMGHLQEYRGLDAFYKNLNITTQGKKKKTVQEIHSSIDKIEKFDKSFGKNFKSTELWFQLKQNIEKAMADSSKLNAENSFNKYSLIISDLLLLINHIADRSKLITDPELDSYYLMYLNVAIIPTLIEDIAQMRGKSSFLLADVRYQSLEEKAELLMLHGRIYALLNKVRYAYDVLDQLGKNVTNYKTDHIDEEGHSLESLEKLAEKQEKFADSFRGLIFEGNAVAKPMDFFKEGTDIIASYFKAYKANTQELGVLLHRRIEQYIFKRNVLILFSTAVIFNILIFYLLFRRSYFRRAQAELFSQTKTEFLANMSHELRTPLNTIIGMSRILKEKEFDSEGQDLVSTVHRSSINLLNIVNDILDISKIEAGEIKIENIGFDIPYLLQGMGQAMEMLAQEKNLTFIKSYQGVEFPLVLGDPVRLNQIINNLVGNAIKYTVTGSVEVRVYYEELNTKSIEFCCEVIDTGIGIEEGKLDTVFDKFTQADVSTTRNFGGTGLGLAITKQLVELMGGTIGVSSQLNKGSVFWFKIPFKTTDHLEGRRSEEFNRSSKGSIPVEKVKVLVAEDHLLNQSFISKVLERFNISEFQIVSNGAEVVKKCKEANWDIVLMDCHMPKLNGYDATEEIRKNEKGTDKHVFIVAMTANVMVGDRDKCLRCGMDDYISKPIDVDELKSILSQWVCFGDKGKGLEKKDKDKKQPADMSLLGDFADTPEEMDEFIEVFISQSQKSLDILEENCVDGECSEWVEAAHKFKGGAAMFGAEKLCLLCQQAQEMQCCTAGERAQLLEDILREYKIVKEYLADYS